MAIYHFKLFTTVELQLADLVKVGENVWGVSDSYHLNDAFWSQVSATIHSCGSQTMEIPGVRPVANSRSTPAGFGKAGQGNQSA